MFPDKSDKTFKNAFTKLIFSIFRRLQFPLLGLLIPYDNDKIEKDVRQSVEEKVSSIFPVEDTFLVFGQRFHNTKKAPAHHISVKGRGLILH